MNSAEESRMNLVHIVTTMILGIRRVEKMFTVSRTGECHLLCCCGSDFGDSTCDMLRQN